VAGVGLATMVACAPVSGPTTSSPATTGNSQGWTALLEAVVLGDGSAPYQQIVQILLAAGADPAIADRQGVTTLQHARNKSQTEVARLLQPR
jgi:ankyrin repeat protein